MHSKRSYITSYLCKSLCLVWQLTNTIFVM